jgi:poly(beta-D-mannuronate) lyase
MKLPLLICASFVVLAARCVTAPAAEPRLPSSILDLDAWKLTLPYNTDRKGDPDEVVQPELETFQDPTCFRASESGDAVVFHAACDGEETENSKYPRSELREMKPGGKDEAGWSTDGKKRHLMEAELAITHLPEVKPHVVCAQIHDEKSDIIMVRLEGKKLFVERKNAEDVELDSDYKLGDRFKLRVLATGGRVKVWYNGQPRMDWETSNKKCYFKAGCYPQSNAKKGEPEGAYGEVVIHRLGVTHE